MFDQLFIYATLAMGALPLVLMMPKARKLPELRPIWPLAALLAVSAVYETIGSVILKINTAFWFQFYLLPEFLCVLQFFNLLFNDRYKRLWLTFLIIFITSFLCLFSLRFFSPRLKTDFFLSTIELGLVFIGSFIWFKDIFRKMKVESLWESPTFYFISALILYFFGTFFLFLMRDIVFTPAEVGRHWVINVVLSLFLGIILSIGIWIGRNKSTRFSG